MKKLLFAVLLSGSLAAMGCQPTEETTEPVTETPTTETTPVEGEEAIETDAEEATEEAAPAAETDPAE